VAKRGGRPANSLARMGVYRYIAGARPLMIFKHQRFQTLTVQYFDTYHAYSSYDVQRRYLPSLSIAVPQGANTNTTRNILVLRRSTIRVFFQLFVSVYLDGNSYTVLLC